LNRKEVGSVPSLEEMQMVGETCPEYDAVDDGEQRSCASCQHWVGDEEMCELDIFFDQLTSLDQT